MKLSFHPEATEAVLNHYGDAWCVAYVGSQPTDIDLITRNDVGDVIYDANLSDENKVVSCVEQFLRDAGYEVCRNVGAVVQPWEIASWSLTAA